MWSTIVFGQRPGVVSRASWRRRDSSDARTRSQWMPSDGFVTGRGRFLDASMLLFRTGFSFTMWPLDQQRWPGCKGRMAPTFTAVYPAQDFPDPDGLFAKLALHLICLEVSGRCVRESALVPRETVLAEKGVSAGSMSIDGTHSRSPTVETSYSSARALPSLPPRNRIF